jgi:surface protein
MILTNGWNLTSGLTFTSSVTPTPPAGGNLVMAFNTALAVTNPNTVYLPLGGTVNALIDWADGNTTLATTTNVYSHAYAATGNYQVTITGTVSEYGEIFSSDENEPLVSVDSWDNDLGLTSMFAAFYSATNLTQVPNTLPITVQFLNSAFAGANIFNQDLTGWDTTNVTGWDQVFQSASAFNGNISTWNTSQAQSMQSFFYNCSQFNGNISSWNVANVTDMDSMFEDAVAFNQDLSGWDVANVTTHVNFDSGATAWQANYQPTFPI